MTLLIVGASRLCGPSRNLLASLIAHFLHASGPLNTVDRQVSLTVLTTDFVGINSTLTIFCYVGFTIILSEISPYLKCEVKLLIRLRTSMFQPLTFGNGEVTALYWAFDH